MVRSTLSCYLVALLVALLLRLTKEESPSVKRISTQGNRIKNLLSFVLLNITLTSNGNSTLFLFRPRPTCRRTLQAQTQ